jgi:molybdenum cofactor biosynthesis enzyme MoaA
MERVMGQALSFTKGGFGIDSIKFCGTTGEPLTNPQVLSAIEMARGRCSLTLFTNGLLMARHAADRRCLAIIAGVNRLNVSLDAASAVTLHEVKPGAANITWRRW